MPTTNRTINTTWSPGLVLINHQWISLPNLIEHWQLEMVINMFEGLFNCPHVLCSYYSIKFFPVVTSSRQVVDRDLTRWFTCRIAQVTTRTLFKFSASLQETRLTVFMDYHHRQNIHWQGIFISPWLWAVISNTCHVQSIRIQSWLLQQSLSVIGRMKIKQTGTWGF